MGSEGGELWRGYSHCQSGSWETSHLQAGRGRAKLQGDNSLLPVLFLELSLPQAAPDMWETSGFPRTLFGHLCNSDCTLDDVRRVEHGGPPFLGGARCCHPQSPHVLGCVLAIRNLGVTETGTTPCGTAYASHLGLGCLGIRWGSPGALEPTVGGMEPLSSSLYSH